MAWERDEHVPLNEHSKYQASSFHCRWYGTRCIAMMLVDVILPRQNAPQATLAPRPPEHVHSLLDFCANSLASVY
jgi:hypothetical protein